MRRKEQYANELIKRLEDCRQGGWVSDIDTYTKDSVIAVCKNIIACWGDVYHEDYCRFVEKPQKSRNEIMRFIGQYMNDDADTKYDAGIVSKSGDNFMIAYETFGAKETFSVGQPVYDKDNNLMGYLGIGVYNSLDYATEKPIRIPVEHWIICLPTKHCTEGKRVYTYWQMKAERGET